MKEYEREAILDRIDRDSATVGVSIPEHITMQGEEIDLQEQVMSFMTATSLDESEDQARQALLLAVRQERNELVDRIEHVVETHEEADAVAERVIGLNRALSVLSAIGTDEDIESAMEAHAVADMQRWISFVKEAKGGIDRGIGR